LAWISEINATRLNAVSPPPASCHHDGGLRAGPAKLVRCLQCIGDSASLRSIEPEAREIALGCRSEKINLVDAFSLRALESLLDELTANARTAVIASDNR
jgi:hypothetical protein